MLNSRFKNFTLYFLLLIGTSNLLAQFEENEKYKIYAINLPGKINFANENVPINELGIKERLDKELLVNTYWQSKTILLIKRAKKYFPIIEKILKENNIPDDFKYLAVAESGLENVTSPSGAKGFWQFLKKTGLEYDLEINSEIDERYHLEKSTQAACQYIQDAFGKFGNWTLAAASYNMGKSGLQKSITLQQVNNYYDLMLNNETYRYIFRILAIKEIIKNHEQYGFVINDDDYYKLTKTKNIKIDTIIKNLASFAIDLKLNYKIIKELNPWILGNSISNDNNKTYLLKIPVKKQTYSIHQDTIIHTCTSKESLFEIAREYNVKIENILSWNKLLPSNKIKKNQQIIILK
ncbi:MAG: murein transglycosylase [Flavobacteriales bacterium]|nr:murein transglycosylase [Flavobacteriales bacterium]